MKKSLLLALIVAAMPCIALADDAKPTLQGGAKATVMDVLAGVKQLTTMCKRIDGDAKVLVYECQRPDLVAVGGPNVVGGMVIPAMPNPSGLMQMQNFLPMRKQRVDEMMSDINPLVGTVQTQIDVIVMPNGVTQEDLDRLSKLQQMNTELQALTAKLNAVTRGPTYKNLEIAEQAILVQDKAKAIDTLAKELERSLRKEK